MLKDWVPPFPRLRYRLRFGLWCDHGDRRGWVHVQGDGSRVVDLDGEVWDAGFTDWELYDLGRAKHRWCRRCGHYETTRSRPIAEWCERRGLVR